VSYFPSTVHVHVRLEMPPKRRSRNEYNVGWICALQIELANCHFYRGSRELDEVKVPFNPVWFNGLYWWWHPKCGNGHSISDVVVSQPHTQYGSVVQYDFGNTGGERRLMRTESLNAPPMTLLTALAKLQSNYIRRRLNLSEHSESVSI